MALGKLTRLNRIFAHPTGRLCSVAVDHFIGYAEGLPAGLRHIQPTLAAIAAARPDAITMHRGLAATAWPPYAGLLPLIMQSTMARLDDTAREQIATPEDAVRLGADAFAIVAFVRGETEAAYLRTVAQAVREAAHFEMPVICHVYPRLFADGRVSVSHAPEDIAWAAHCAVECGVDVVKTPYCGDPDAYAEIVRDGPVPIVAAGGPKSESLAAALHMASEVVASGARGATIGRNVWGFAHVTANVQAFKAVIHDGQSPAEALRRLGLAPEQPAQGGAGVSVGTRG